MASPWSYVGFDVLTAVVMKSSVHWDIMPCILVNVNRRFGGTSSLNILGWRVSHTINQLQVGNFMLVSCFPYSSTLNKEATCSSKTAVNIHRIIWRYIPECRTLHGVSIISAQDPFAPNTLHSSVNFIMLLSFVSTSTLCPKRIYGEVSEDSVFKFTKSITLNVVPLHFTSGHQGPPRCTVISPNLPVE
jgi:hypothetical protein